MTEENTLSQKQYNNLITNRPNLFSYLDVTKKAQDQYTYKFLETVDFNNITKLSGVAFTDPELDLNITTTTLDFKGVFEFDVDNEEYDEATEGKTTRKGPLTGSNVLALTHSNEELPESTNIHFELKKPYTVSNDVQIEVFMGETEQTRPLKLKKRSTIFFVYLYDKQIETGRGEFTLDGQEYSSTNKEIKKLITNLQVDPSGGGKTRTKRRIPFGLIASKKRRRNSRKIQKNKSNLNFSTKKK